MNSETISSQTQVEPDNLTIRKEGHDLPKYYYTFSTWMGASDLFTDWQVFQSHSASSSPTMLLAESAAIAYHEDRELEAQIDTILNIACIEGFEDGMEGRTSHFLNLFVSEHPIAGMQQLTVRLNSEHINQVVAADIVRALGRIKHARSHDDRRYIAECLLYSKLPIARDAGAVALSDLADKRSIPALQRAIEAESIPELKADLQASFDELIKDTYGVHPQKA